MAKTPDSSPPPDADQDWQDRDIDMGLLAIIMGAVFGIAIASAVGMNVLMKYYDTREDARDQPFSVLGTARDLPEGTLLQVDPPGELAVHNAGQQALINGYAWVDETTGIARIPVDRAMAIVAEKGVPEFTPMGAEE